MTSSIYLIWNSDLKIFIKQDLLIVRSTNQVSFHNFSIVLVTGSPKKYYFFLFLVQNTSLSLCANEKCKLHFNNNSSKVYMLFFSESAVKKIILYFGQCITICGPEFQHTSVIAYSCFCLSYRCFSFMKRTWLCWHHCFKFSGNDSLRNRDGGVGTYCWTLVTVKLCWFRYWHTGIIYLSFILPNVVSFY